MRTREQDIPVDRARFRQSERPLAGVRWGHIKFFMMDKGMGFIVDDEDPSVDVFLHSTTLAEHRRDGLLIGTTVSFEVCEDAGGHRRATRVLTIDESTVPPEALVDRGKTILPQRRRIASSSDGAIETLMLRVKFFKPDGDRGFGFFADPDHEDVFVHMKTVKASGFVRIEAGDVFEVDVGMGTRGRIATAIRLAANKAFE